MISTFPILFGSSCNFSGILAVSGTGPFTFVYKLPYLYVTDETALGVGRILIYDVTTAASPVLLSTTNVPSLSGPWHPVIDGNTLYIPYRVSKKLALWNVTDRTAPVLLGEVTFADSPLCVAVLGTNAAVGFGPGFTHSVDAAKVDCSNPASPTVVDDVQVHPPTAALVNSIQATSSHFILSGQYSSGTSVYVAGVDASSFNLTDVTTDGLSSAGILQDMVISADYQYAYCTNNGNGRVDSWDISNPADILLIDQLAGVAALGPQALCLVDSTDRLYVGQGNSANMKILDVSDPTNMSQTGTITTSGETVNDIVNTDGCPGLVWGQGTGAAIHLNGTAPLS